MRIIIIALVSALSSLPAHLVRPYGNSNSPSDHRPYASNEPPSVSTRRSRPQFQAVRDRRSAAVDREAVRISLDRIAAPAVAVVPARHHEPAERYVTPTAAPTFTPYAKALSPAHPMPAPRAEARKTERVSAVLSMICVFS